MKDKYIKSYIASLLDKNLREDGRKAMDYRNIEIEINPLPRANGSARVKIGNSEILVGVKLDVGRPFPDGPTSGTLMTNAELIPMAYRKFESGPPSPVAIETSRVIDRAIRESHAIDMNHKDMCIEAKEKVWMVFIDIYPLNYDGNLYDAGVLGAMVALKNAKFPRYDAKEEKVHYTDLTSKGLPLKNVPIMCTFGKINGKMLLDPTAKEAEAMDARISIGTTEKGNICAMQKGEEGTFTQKEVEMLVDLAVKKGKELRKLVK